MDGTKGDGIFRAAALAAIALAFTIAFAGITAAATEAASGGEAARAQAFREFAEKLAKHQKISPALFHALVAATNHGVTSGPAVGQKVPDFSLPDENGRRSTLHQLMGSRGLLLVFLRSADW